MGFHVGFQWGFLSILWEIIGKLTGPRKSKKPLTTSMLNPLYEKWQSYCRQDWYWRTMFLYVVACQFQREILSHWDLYSGLERGSNSNQTKQTWPGVIVCGLMSFQYYFRANLGTLISPILYSNACHSNVLPVQHAILDQHGST